MSCTSYTLSGLNAQCKNSVGGIQEIYIGKYDNLLSFELDANGLIIPVMHRGNYQKLLKYELRKNTASMISNIVKNDNGGDYFQTDLTMRFGKMETAKRIEIMALVNTDVFAIVKDVNGKYWVLGKDEPLQLSAAQGLTGNTRSDANEYTFTLTDTSNELPFEMSFETLRDLLTDWTTKFLTFEILEDNTVISLTCANDYVEFGASFCVIQANERDNYYNLTSKQINDNYDWWDISADGTYSSTAEYAVLYAGDRVLFQSVDPYTYNDGAWAHFESNKPVKIYGNLCGMFDGDLVIKQDQYRDYDYSGDCNIYGLFDTDYASTGAHFLSDPVKEITISFASIGQDEEYEPAEALFGRLFANTGIEYGPYMRMTDCNKADMISMFDNAKNLKYIQADFGINQIYTTDWALDVSTYGTFRTSNPSNLNQRGTSAIPNKWRISYTNN